MLHRYFYLFIILIPFFALAQKNEVIDSSFVIRNNPQKIYRGIYKNNLPYKGYFKAGYDDFSWVNFYKNGIKTAQYSFDLQEYFIRYKNKNNQNSSKTIYNIKSTFKNEKIVNGEIKDKYKNIYISKKISDGKITEVDVDIFTNNINRLNIKVNKKNLILSYLKDTISTVELSLNNDQLALKLSTKKNTLISYNLNNYSFKKIKPNSITTFFKVKKDTHCIVIDKKKEFLKYKDNSFIIKKFITNIDSFSSKNDINSILDQFLENLKHPYKTTKKEPLVIGYIITSINGFIDHGIYWKDNIYKVYKNNKIVKEEKCSFKNFQTIITNYIQ